MYNKIVELIEKKDVVSFDIFDTLVFRNVAKPLDIFRIVENIVKKEYNFDDFKRKRIEAESNARKIAKNGEASYDEIYAQLKNEIKDENIIKNIKKCEKDIEERFIVQNPFMKKIFELFPNDKYIKYLYVSRNSTQIPVVLSGNSEDKIKFILSSIEGHITLKKLFNNCKLETKKEYEKIIKLYGFDSFDNEIKDRQRYDALKCVCAVLNDAEDKIKADKELVKKYLEQEGLNNFDTINVIDIGWGGSIQASIQKILNKKVRGYYLGTINRGDYDFNLNSFGYLFDQDNDIYDKSMIFSQVMMYELIFSAPHGSVNRYEEKDGKIVPVLKKQDDYSEIVDKFQKASLEVIEEIMKYYEYYDNINKKFAFKFYQEFLYTYNWEDLVEFSSIENDCFIGNDTKFPYVQILQKQLVIENFNKLKEITDKSLWKGAFLIEGCKNKEEHNLFLEKTRKMYYPELYPSRLRMTLRKIIPLKVRKVLKKQTYKPNRVKE